MKKTLMLLGLLISSFTVIGADMSNGADNFYKSDKVAVQKVTFKNQYQMNVAGNLFIPKDFNRNAKNSAIIVGHPMGAVKELFHVYYSSRHQMPAALRLFIELVRELRPMGL